jgi:sortase A
MKFKNPQIIIEQIALLFASFVWTIIVLTAITFIWAYQDVQTRWELVMNIPPEALAQVPPTPTPLPSPTVWAGPGPTITPTPPLPPSPTPTRVVAPPEILPETLNPGEPTPIPVIVHTEDEAAEFGLTQSTNAGPVTIGVQSTPQTVNESEPVQEAPQVEQNPPATILTNQPVQSPQPGPAEAAPAISAPGDFNPTRVVISSVGIDSSIIPVGWNVIEKDGLQYSIWQVADFAVGWHKTTAALGKSGNTVLTGHHNVNGEVFRDLVNVEVGDTIVAYAGNQKFEYSVELKTIVKEKGEPVEVRRRNAQWIADTDDERVTFVTCWPYTNNTHRVIVVAKPA